MLYVVSLPKNFSMARMILYTKLVRFSESLEFCQHRIRTTTNNPVNRIQRFNAKFKFITPYKKLMYVLLLYTKMLILSMFAIIRI